jgi:hypothetical protein
MRVHISLNAERPQRITEESYLILGRQKDDVQLGVFIDSKNHKLRLRILPLGN